MGQVADLIAEQLKAMIQTGDLRALQSKRKAISALLPYAVWQERDRGPEMLDTLLSAARASRMLKFMWDRVGQYAGRLLSKATPRAVVLISPHIPWSWSTDGEDRADLVRWWAEAVPTVTVPHSEEVGRCVVDTLLQIASEKELLPHIPVDVWSWLNERPLLPPTCLGRYVGTWEHVVEAVRKLEDIEILKSYFLLVWSEWDCLRIYSLNKMRISIREDFGGVGMDHHRAELIQRLDYIMEQLDGGLDHFRQHDPNLTAGYLRNMKHDYGRLRDILVETNNEAVACMSYPSIALLCMLTQVETRRISCDVYYVRASSPMAGTPNLIRLLLPPYLHTDFDTHTHLSHLPH